MSATVMLDEVRQLDRDVPALVAAADEQLAAAAVAGLLDGIRRVILTGCGDSHHAAEAAGLAFAEVAPCPADIIAPRTFVADHHRGLSGGLDKTTMLVAISVSGGTPAVLDALRTARAGGARTLIVTGRADSAATELAEDAVIVDVAAPVQSPGIRTFQASLVTLFVLAGRLARACGAFSAPQGQVWHDEILAAGDSLRATTQAAEPLARAIAEETVLASISLMLAAGPHLGIARFAAAKRMEASGLFAAAQDSEEWWHGERFAYPTDMPVFIIAPPGATEADAGRTAFNTRGLGRHVIAVCAPEATAVTAHAHTVLPLMGAVREGLSPLLTYPALTLVAAHEALGLDRRPFQQDHPDIRDRLDRYRTRMEAQKG